MAIKFEGDVWDFEALHKYLADVSIFIDKLKAEYQID
jgi:hypothetical protein